MDVSTPSDDQTWGYLTPAAATYNHTRADSPATPCTICRLAVERDEARKALAEERANVKQLGDFNQKIVNEWSAMLVAYKEIVPERDDLRAKLAAAEEQLTIRGIRDAHAARDAALAQAEVSRNSYEMAMDEKFAALAESGQWAKACQDLAAKLAEMRGLGHDCSSIIAERDDLLEQLNEAVEEARNVTAKLAAAEADVRDLSAHLSMAKDARDAALARVDGLERENDALRQALGDAKTDYLETRAKYDRDGVAFLKAQARVRELESYEPKEWAKVTARAAQLEGALDKIETELCYMRKCDRGCPKCFGSCNFCLQAIYDASGS